MAQAIKIVEGLISKINGLLSEDGPFTPRLIWVSAPIGGGKTTLCENMKRKLGCIHFDADKLHLGGDALLDSSPRASDTAAMRSTELIGAHNIIIKDGYDALWEGKSPPLSVWTPFYAIVCREIRRTRREYPEKHIVIAQAVYTRAVRDYIRSELGARMTFLILNTDVETSAQRIIARIGEKAAAVGKTDEEYLQSEWRKTNLSNGGPLTGGMAQYKKEWAGKMPMGFEAMQKDEPNTVQIEVSAHMSKDQVFDAAVELLSL